MMERLSLELDYAWHRAINQYHEGKIGTADWKSWLYEAKALADEVPRLTMLFGLERTGKLPTVHHQCSHDTEGTPVPDNHLTCCLGVPCRKCPYLQALEKAEAKPEEIDQIKAWTCATHIIHEVALHEYRYDTSEGFLLTVDDQTYWERVYQNLSHTEG